MSMLLMNNNNVDLQQPPPLPPSAATTAGGGGVGSAQSTKNKLIFSTAQMNSLRNKAPSYEDLLINKYLDQIQHNGPKIGNHKSLSGNTVKSNKRLEIDSPYLQKLHHSNLLQTLLTNTATNANNSQRTGAGGSITNINSTRSNRTLSRTNSALASRPTSGVYHNHQNKFENIFNTHQHQHQLNNNSASTKNSSMAMTMGAAANFINLKQQQQLQFSSRAGSSSLANHQSSNNNNNYQSLHLSLRRDRPCSAPLDRSVKSQTITKRSHRYSKANNFKHLSKQPFIIKALVFKNGSRNMSAHVAARNLNEFLEIATDKLQCPRAARRLFLENGDEIKHESQFMKNAVVYVSCGEEFDDPFLQTKKLIDQRRSVMWTSDGVHFMQPNGAMDANASEAASGHAYEDDFDSSSSVENLSDPFKIMYGNVKPPKNDRLTRMRCTRRMMVFENGASFNPALVVLEIPTHNDMLKKELDAIGKLEKEFLEDFYHECSDRLHLSGQVKSVFNWKGKQVYSISDVPKLDKCLQQFLNDVEYAPVWASKGENFDSRGPLNFMSSLLKKVKENKKNLRKEKEKQLKLLDDVREEEGANSAAAKSRTIQSRIAETNENIRNLSKEISRLHDAIAHLESIYNELQTIHEQQSTGGFKSLYEHIKEIDTESKIFGGTASKGIKLKVFINGSDDQIAEIYYNLKEAIVAKTKEAGLNNLLAHITQIVHNHLRSSPAVFTRIFKENGEEITSVRELKTEDSIWISQGEAWKSSTTMILSMPVDMVFGIKQSPLKQKFSTENFGDDYVDEFGEQKSMDDDDDDDDKIPTSRSNEELRNFFKGKTTIAAKNFSKNTATETAANGVESSAAVLGDLKIYKEPLKIEKVKKYDKPDNWDLVEEWELEKLLNATAHVSIVGGGGENAQPIDSKKALSKCLKCKLSPELILHPQLRLMKKLNESSTTQNNNNNANSIWFSNFQLWKFNRAGYIYNSFFPKICLALNASVSIQLDLLVKKPFKSTAAGNMSNRSNNKNNHQSVSFENDEFSGSPPSHQSEVITKRGHVVVLSTRQLNDNNNYRDKDQQWSFNTNGSIYSKALDDKNFVFTSMDVLHRELRAQCQSGSSLLEKYEFKITDSSGESTNLNDYAIILLETFDNQLSSKLAKSQRWAIKQENSRSIGEWRFSSLATPEWHKLAYTWPVDDKGQLIKEFSWPLTGYLIPAAPPLRSLEAPTEGSRTRLRVLKNGSLDTASAINVSRLDNKNLMKQYIHCTNVSYRQFEFNVFLDTCTTSLNLPNAARRIFDENGIEHFELSKLAQDQLIYVSMGDPWIPPKLIREEQEKKILLANMADDLAKVSYFLKLKTCENLVLEASNAAIQDGSKLVLGACCLSRKQIERIKRGESLQHVIELEDEDEVVITETIKKKAHQISHEKTDEEYAKKRRKPWELGISLESLKNEKSRSNDSLDKSNLTATSDDEKDKSDIENSNSNLKGGGSQISLNKSIENELKEKLKHRPKKSQKNVKLNSQKFAFNKESGYIYCVDNPNLVFTVSEIDTNLNEVYLMKKNDDNINQRWQMKSNNGIISSKSRPNMVLTVKLPSIENSNALNKEEETSSVDIVAQTSTSTTTDQQAAAASAAAKKKTIYWEASVVLQPLIDFDTGNAHQKWRLDEDLGFIYSFAADSKNIEITAANKASICSYYVAREEELSQPGYLCEFTFESNDSSDKSNNSKLENQKSTNSLQQVVSQEPKIEKKLICSSCAKGTRGKFKLSKTTRQQKFSCYMGNANKDKSLKQYGCFKYLGNKIDLRAGEAEKSYEKWLADYRSKHSSHAKVLLNELSSLTAMPMMKFYAYRNGDGRLKKGEILIGSSIQAILDQAAKKLGLRGAARRIFTEDGRLILDVHDLMSWCVEFYRNLLNKNETVELKSESNSLILGTNSNKSHPKQVKIDDGKGLKSSLKAGGSFQEKSEIINRSYSIFKESTVSADSMSKNSESLANKIVVEEKPVPFRGPSARDMKRIVGEYDKMSKLDPKLIFRWPIEVWISCGEPFVSPGMVVKNETLRLMNRETVDKAEHELEKQSHLLRQMQGRRLTTKSFGKYKSIKNPDVPVVREGHWTEVTYEEQVKQVEVSQLKNVVTDIKSTSKPPHVAKPKADVSSFGKHAINKRIRVYLNGDLPEKAQQLWASTMEELNEAAKIKLNLSKPIKFFFTEDGKIISQFEDIARDQLVCVSLGREFIPLESRNREIEIKATWSRVKKTKGLEATNLKIKTLPNPVVNVDPFGPSHAGAIKANNNNNHQQLLALPPPPPQSQQPSASASTSNRQLKKQSSSSKPTQPLDDDPFRFDQEEFSFSLLDNKKTNNKQQKSATTEMLDTTDTTTMKETKSSNNNNNSRPPRRNSRRNSSGKLKSKSKSPKKVQIDSVPSIMNSNDENSKAEQDKEEEKNADDEIYEDMFEDENVLSLFD